MPENALAAVEVDYCLPVSEMASLLVRLTKEGAAKEKNLTMEENKKTKLEVRIAAQDNVPDEEVLQLGQFTPYACPECHGVLSAIKDGGITRYRCHTGHAYTQRTLEHTQGTRTDEALWRALRALQEREALLGVMAEACRERSDTHEAERLEAGHMKTHARQLQRIVSGR